MIWGADPWNKAAFPKGAALDPALHEQPVTAANYHAYAARRDTGLQPQGCGITQLTSPSLQKQADQNGSTTHSPDTPPRRSVLAAGA